MSDTREVMDRLTAGVAAEDPAAIAACYSADAVLVAPEGTFKGRDQITEFFTAWFAPFSDTTIEVAARGEWGNRAVDEWVFSGTNSGDLAMPTGETVPATGKRVTIRGADLGTVEGGVVTEHHIYYDQVELLGQLGLLPE